MEILIKELVNIYKEWGTIGLIILVLVYFFKNSEINIKYPNNNRDKDNNHNQ